MNSNITSKSTSPILEAMLTVDLVMRGCIPRTNIESGSIILRLRYTAKEFKIRGIKEEILKFSNKEISPSEIVKLHDYIRKHEALESEITLISQHKIGEIKKELDKNKIVDTFYIKHHEFINKFVPECIKINFSGYPESSFSLIYDETNKKYTINNKAFYKIESGITLNKFQIGWQSRFFSKESSFFFIRYIFNDIEKTINTDSYSEKIIFDVINFEFLKLEKIKSYIDFIHKERDVGKDKSLFNKKKPHKPYLVLFGLLLVVFVVAAQDMGWKIPLITTYETALKIALFITTIGTIQTAYCWKNSLAGVGATFLIIVGFSLKYGWNISENFLLYIGLLALLLIVCGIFPALIGILIYAISAKYILTELWSVINDGWKVINYMALIPSIAGIFFGTLMINCQEKVDKSKSIENINHNHKKEIIEEIKNEFLKKKSIIIWCSIISFCYIFGDNINIDIYSSTIIIASAILITSRTCRDVCFIFLKVMFILVIAILLIINSIKYFTHNYDSSFIPWPFEKSQVVRSNHATTYAAPTKGKHKKIR